MNNLWTTEIDRIYGGRYMLYCKKEFIEASITEFYIDKPLEDWADREIMVTRRNFESNGNNSKRKALIYEDSKITRILEV